MFHVFGVKKKTGIFVFLLIIFGLPATGFSMARAPQSDAVEQSWWRGAQPEEGGLVSVYRSPADDRAYRYIELDNRLKVLLISDPKSDKSAASLDVHIGSFQNPKEREGLAHFLEHMLFLGTDKYPEAGQYQAFISEHGGSHNAYTSLEHTNYFFDIDPLYLESALDRFAQFFTAPRFDAAYVERERKAVESEYRLKIKDDGRREWEVLSEVINPAHPLSQFTVGSLQTLADREEAPVRDDLLTFYRQYYSANLMSLVVLGKQPLDQLQGWIEARFGEISNSDTSIAPTPVDLLSEHRGHQINIVPEKEKRELSLLFPMERLQPHWRTKPAAFLGHLLGDEGKESLLSELKRRGWAEGLSAGSVFDSRHGAAFAINIALTPSGVDYHSQVQDLVFVWLNKIKREGIEQWRYQELAELNRVSFRFLDKMPAASFVRSLASALHDYPAAEVMRGQFDYQQFDADLILSVANNLSADNVLVTLVAPRGAEQHDYPRLSQRYQAPYAVQAISGERISAWQQPNSKSLEADLSLPGKNPYLAEHFPVSGGGGSPRLPEKVIDSDVVSLWHYQDNQFASPRSVVDAKILAPSIASLRGTALGKLYLAMVLDELNTEVYPAMLAGLNFDLGLWSHGINLTVSGYADKQDILLARVLKVLAAPEWDEQRFERLKNQLIRQWQNSRKQWPVRQVLGEVRPLLSGGHRPVELAEVLESVDMAALRHFVGTLYQTSRAEIYVGGVLDRGRATRMAQSVIENLSIDKAPIEEASYQVVQLSPASRSPHHGIEVNHPDETVVLYLQAVEDSLVARAQFAVLQNILEAPFYTTLRTEKQLGYVVGARVLPLRKVPGMSMYVQSPTADHLTLKAEIEHFLQDQKAAVNALEEADLSRYKLSVLSVLEERPKNIIELAGRHLEDLSLDHEQFDFREKLAEAVREISLQEIKDLYGSWMNGARRALWLSARSSEAGGTPAVAISAEQLREMNGNKFYQYPAL